MGSKRFMVFAALGFFTDLVSVALKLLSPSACPGWLPGVCDACARVCVCK